MIKLSEGNYVSEKDIAAIRTTKAVHTVSYSYPDRVIIDIRDSKSVVIDCDSYEEAVRFADTIHLRVSNTGV